MRVCFEMVLELLIEYGEHESSSDAHLPNVIHFGNGLLTVVDYLRPWNQALYVPIVPVYPEKGDMLLVQGEGPSDVWYGNVQDIDFRNKSVDVYFFIESRRCPNVFVRDSRHRGARNTVSWRSVIGVADGHWSGPGMWTKDLRFCNCSCMDS